MQILTSRFGLIEVPEEEIIYMPHGMIGFIEEKKFVLRRHAENSPFLWFQSLRTETLAFVLIDPFLFEPTYQIQITDEDRRDLEWNGAEEGIQALVVVNFSNKDQVFKVTANLLAPILINTKKRLAKQVILYESQYSYRYPLPLKTQTDSSDMK